MTFLKNKSSEEIFSIITKFLVLIFCSLYLFSFLPLDYVFSPHPATGGDTGSHFWPVKILAEHGLPQFKVHLWNPGNLGGEPLFFHYFPLPFIIIALLGKIIPLGMAFNIGTLLGLVFLPGSIYFCSRSFGLKAHTSLINAIASLLFIFNETFSMFGGNTLSTLAGQFSHGYALCFFFIGTGFYIKELRKDRFSFWGLIFFTCTAFSHAYVFIIVPIIFLSALITYKKKTRFWLKNAFYGIYILLLSSWFIFPMLQNQKWMSPTAMVFGTKHFMSFIQAPIFIYFLFLSIPIILTVFFLLYKKKSFSILKFHLFWLTPLAAYIGLFFLFPKIGLVDVRALPQIALFALLIISSFWGILLTQLKHQQPLINTVTLALMCFTFWWVGINVKEFPNWAKWNYSSWQTKPLYPSLQQLSQDIEGSLF